MNIERRKLLLLGCVTAMGRLVLANNWAQAAGVRILSGPAFGSTWRLILSNTAEDPSLLISEIVRRIDEQMSPYHSYSDLWKFNKLGTITARDELRHVVLTALDLAKLSGGAFDPTSAPIGRKYGFGPEAISDAAPAGKYTDIHVLGERIDTSTPQLTLDLNGIAKGYALDIIAAELVGLDFLLELGGEVVARGHHPSARRWKVGIERPGTGKIQRLINTGNQALATSGDTTQSYAIGGRRYAHVVDPRTGGPLENDVASVSVLAPSGMLADGLATAAMVLGPDASLHLLSTFNASALFLLRNGNGFIEITCGDFPLEDLG